MRIRKRFIFNIGMVSLLCSCSSSIFVSKPDAYFNGFVKHFKCNDPFIYVVLNERDLSLKNEVKFCIKDAERAILRMVQRIDIAFDYRPCYPLDDITFPHVEIYYGQLAEWPDITSEGSYTLEFQNRYNSRNELTTLGFRDYDGKDSWTGTSEMYTIKKSDTEEVLDFCFILFPELKEKYDMAMKEMQKVNDTHEHSDTK